ncbi:hypothetical protein QE152_g18988 [Popillia japonica]|uniref:Uncharacterized protein n=1 Tax=Popillia japonica TaxID=7064 RepID=A0AAW1L493_POPJA
MTATHKKRSTITEAFPAIAFLFGDRGESKGRPENPIAFAEILSFSVSNNKCLQQHCFNIDAHIYVVSNCVIPQPKRGHHLNFPKNCTDFQGEWLRGSLNTSPHFCTKLYNASTTTMLHQTMKSMVQMLNDNLYEKNELNFATPRTVTY